MSDRAEEIALAHHSDQPALRVEHGRRTHIGSVEDHRSLRQCDVVRHHHRRLVHHIRDGQARRSRSQSSAVRAGPVARTRHATSAPTATGASRSGTPHDATNRHRRHPPVTWIPRHTARPRSGSPTGWPITFGISSAYPVLSAGRAGCGAAAGCRRRPPPERRSDSTRCSADIEELLCPATTHWQSPGFMAYFASSGSGPGHPRRDHRRGAERERHALADRARGDRARNGGTGLAPPDGRAARAPVRASSTTPRHRARCTRLPPPARRRPTCAFASSAWRAGPNSHDLRYYASQRRTRRSRRPASCSASARDGLRRIPVDERFRMDPVALRQAIHEDIAAGIRPFAVVATAGTTSTTSVDPIPAIATVCEHHGLWLHVDAAYGGAAAVAPELRWVLDGAERADSIVINPHKWLFTPIDCSVLWTRGSRRPSQTRSRSFRSTSPRPTVRGRTIPNLMDYGTSLGRRMRALKLWMVIRHFGTDGLARAFASTVSRVDRRALGRAGARLRAARACTAQRRLPARASTRSR